MEITIIGTGNMARGIATRALAGGHTVTLLGTATEKAEQLAGELGGDVRAGSVGDPLGAKVVKAFNTTFAGTLVAGDVGGQPLDVFAASDDEEAKDAIRQIASGLRVVDAGPLAHARQLEALGYLHMAIQGGLGTGYASAVKVVA